jgi:hypothetical protein
MSADRSRDPVASGDARSATSASFRVIRPASRSTASSAAPSTRSPSAPWTRHVPCATPAPPARCGGMTRTRRGPWRAACKPSSVVSRCRSSVTDGHPSERPTRELSEPPAAAEAALRSPIRSCSGQSLPRFTPRPGLATGGASSLWRWSSPHGGRALPADLLYGARTFLGRGLSTDAPAAVQPPPGMVILPRPAPNIEQTFRERVADGRMTLTARQWPRCSAGRRPC